MRFWGHKDRSCGNLGAQMIPEGASSAADAHEPKGNCRTRARSLPGDESAQSKCPAFRLSSFADTG
jgi:hypothetical protein